MHATTPLELLRPFFWLAAVAFLLGFVSYLAVGGGHAVVTHIQPPSAAAMVSGPASDDWNLPKPI